MRCKKIKESYIISVNWFLTFIAFQDDNEAPTAFRGRVRSRFTSPGQTTGTRVTGPRATGPRATGTRVRIPTGPRAPTGPAETSGLRRAPTGPAEETGPRTRLSSSGRRRRVKTTTVAPPADEIVEEDRRSATFNRGNRLPAGDGLTGVRRRIPTGGRRRIRPINSFQNFDEEEEEEEEEEEDDVTAPAPSIQVSTVSDA